MTEDQKAAYDDFPVPSSFPPDVVTRVPGADDLRRRTEAEGWALLEAEKHQPEPGGCTCGFCAWSVDHVVIMSLRAAMAHA